MSTDGSPILRIFRVALFHALLITFIVWRAFVFFQPLAFALIGLYACGCTFAYQLYKINRKYRIETDEVYKGKSLIVGLLVAFFLFIIHLAIGLLNLSTEFPLFTNISNGILIFIGGILTLLAVLSI